MKADRLPASAWRATAILGLASTADWYLFLAVFWIAAERGWSGSQLALLVLAGRLPTFVGGTLGGRAVDHFGPRAMLLFDATVRGATFAGLTVIGVAGQDSYLVLIVASAICGASSPITYAACRVLMPMLVPASAWARGNAVLSLGDQLPVVLSALLVGPALLWFGAGAYAVPLLLVLGAGLLALSGFRGIRLSHVRPSGQDGRAGRIRGPSPWTASVVALLTLSTAYYFVFGPFPPLLPVLVRDNLGGDASTYSLMRVAVGLGALCGLTLATQLASFNRPGVVNAVGVVVYGLTLFPLVLMHSVAPAVVLYFVTGVVWGPYAAIEATALQRWLPAGHLGRVFGTQRALSITAIPLGGAIGSLALGAVSASTVMGASAIACSVVGGVALCVPALRRPST